MKRLLQLLVPIVVLLSACQKEQSLELGTNNPGPGGPGTGGPGTGGGGNNNTYYFECKIGGVTKTFNVATTAVTQDLGGQIATAVGGKANSDPGDTEQFSFMIQTASSIATGTYKVDNLSGSYTMLVTYMPSGGVNAVPYLTGSGLIFGTPFRVNVTSVNSTEIEGTFSGSIFEIDMNNPSPSPNMPSKAVADGKFKVKFL
jgi:hypothetical protein